ncbi:hypothetical protein VKT23_012365 [Stygiomarasmius scandens]|uniref:Uncharacterized protein n=1 Tax=Marasmiellus scandens TaxID=2682957 RepID=A0ABR1J8I0_9AGAR
MSINQGMMKFNNSLCVLSCLLCTVVGQTVTFFGVFNSQEARLITGAKTATSRGPHLPSASIDYDITPIGTAESGSETTYSYHEVANINLDPAASTDVQSWTVEGILVESASGYRNEASQVFNPTSSGTISVGVISGNCTFNEDGNGVCLQTEAGRPRSTATFTGTVLPVMTTVFDVDNNRAAGIGLQTSKKMAWCIGATITIVLILVA